MKINSQIELSSERMGPDKAIIRVKQGERTIRTEEVQILNQEDKARFCRDLCLDRPGIDPQDLADQLEDVIAKELDRQKKADSPAGHEKDEERAAQSAALIRFLDDAELFHDGDVAYATVQVEELGPDHKPTGNTHHETHGLTRNSFKSWLRGKFWRSSHKAVSSAALGEAVGTLEGMALHDGEQHTVGLRLLEQDGALYLDLCNEHWEVVRITPDGWQVVTDPNVKFIRKQGMRPLPHPVRGGRIDELRRFVNLPDDETFILAIAWVFGAFHRRGPYPVLAINGEQGSAKSTACKMLRGLIDPNQADVRAAPGSERDLMIAAANSRVIGFDNLSTISPGMSDAICRLATGAGLSTRALFTDDDERIFCAARPVIFNGIEESATRPDLLERVIVLHLPTIPESARQTEEKLWAAYHEARPRILGALLDAVAVALRNRGKHPIDDPPRMADFAQWVSDAEPALGWERGAFVRTYRENQTAANDLAIESSPIGRCLLGFMLNRRVWSGTAKELLAELNADRHSDRLTRERKEWPGTPKALSNALRRLLPTLRRLGVEITFDQRSSDRNRDRLIHIRASKTPSEPSGIVQMPQDGAENAVFDQQERTVVDDASLEAPKNRPHEIPSLSRPADDADDVDGVEGPSYGFDHPFGAAMRDRLGMANPLSDVSEN